MERNKEDEDKFLVPFTKKEKELDVNKINLAEYKLEISSADLIPEGDKLDFSGGSEQKVFLSNNQKYKKKEEIEYGKKSHLEYLKFIQNNKDPLGVQAKGGLQPYTLEDVKLHNQPSDLWTIINNNVYDVTKYLDYHPGGPSKLLKGAGRDCTSLFNKYHPWVNYHNLIGKLQIGYIVKEKENDPILDNIIDDK